MNLATGAFGPFDVCTIREIADWEPGLNGLILIPNVTHRGIAHPIDVFKLGQCIDAMIIMLNVEAKRISLSTSKLEQST